MLKMHLTTCQAIGLGKPLKSHLDTHVILLHISRNWKVPGTLQLQMSQIMLMRQQKF